MKLTGGDRDRGAAAVEFALIALMLITILFGVIEFGRFWMIQSTLSQVAREGVREMAIKDDADSAETLMKDRLASLNLDVAPTVSASGPGGGACTSGGTATATVTAANVKTMSGIDFWGTITLTGKAEMRCGG